MDLATIGPLVIVGGLLALVVYTAVWLSRPATGPALGSHYNPGRYAKRGAARKPERVGICDECGTKTEPEEEYCPVCSGFVREVAAD